jgi:ADYC domain
MRGATFVCVSLLFSIGCDDVEEDESDWEGEWLPTITYNGVSPAAAAAKCERFGYDRETAPDHHAACVRMVRADYCGDGTSWTRNGAAINFYDSLGIHADATDWPVDAAWAPDGAICTNHIRDFQPGAPPCVEELHDPACGGFEDGALLINEYDR